METILEPDAVFFFRDVQENHFFYVGLQLFIEH